MYSNHNNKVAVSEEEKSLSYYKYFLCDMAEVPPEKTAIWEAGPANPGSMLPFEKKNLFLEGKHNGFCTCGYGVSEEGTGFVCNTTYMPGVTPEMLDWWFPWHSVGSDLRYKIWDPQEHYFARAHPASYVLDPDVPMAQKTWGVDHYIMEDIGTGPEFLKLKFLKPSDMGYDMSLIGTEKCASMVCAIGESSCPAIMTHKWYPQNEGVVFESRFWIGYRMQEDKFERLDVKIPAFVPKALFGHNIREFSNLAAILPYVYEEEKNNF